MPVRSSSWARSSTPLHLSRTDRINVLWDVEPESDPEVGRDSARIVRHVLENVRPGPIVLLHVMTRTREPSRAAVPGIVRELPRAATVS